MGKVEQPITSAMPRGTTVKRFSILMGSCLPCGFSQSATPGMRDISCQA
ncbi:Uncharacterised protein [Bordetella pertussis]|nr:Uncharacterised protein [Bordetella pertussis]CFP67575.1 Uncharacterised protein [Bordetella pertussis]CFW50692.1 Uncharacterised protein [Bordetella pertussis]